MSINYNRNNFSNLPLHHVFQFCSLPILFSLSSVSKPILHTLCNYFTTTLHTLDFTSCPSTVNKHAIAQFLFLLENFSENNNNNNYTNNKNNICKDNNLIRNNNDNTINNNNLSITHIILKNCRSLTDDILLVLVSISTVVSKSLQYIDISGCIHLTKESISIIGTHCPQLETFIAQSLINTIIMPRYISELFSSCSHLKKIDISYCIGATNALPRALTCEAAQEQLETLIIDDCNRITDRGLNSMFSRSTFKKLKKLSLKRLFGITDSSIGLLVTGCCPKISELNLNQTSISGLALERISETVPSRIQHLSIEGCPLQSQNYITCFQSFCDIQSLDLSNLREVMDNHVLSEFGNTLFHIQYLSIEGCNLISGNGLKQFIENAIQNHSEGVLPLKTLLIQRTQAFDDIGINSLYENKRALSHLKKMSFSGNLNHNNSQSFPLSKHIIDKFILSVKRREIPLVDINLSFVKNSNSSLEFINRVLDSLTNIRSIKILETTLGMESNQTYNEDLNNTLVEDENTISLNNSFIFSNLIENNIDSLVAFDASYLSKEFHLKLKSNLTISYRLTQLRIPQISLDEETCFQVCHSFPTLIDLAFDGRYLENCSSWEQIADTYGERMEQLSLRCVQQGDQIMKILARRMKRIQYLSINRWNHLTQNSVHLIADDNLFPELQFLQFSQIISYFPKVC